MWGFGYFFKKKMKFALSIIYVILFRDIIHVCNPLFTPGNRLSPHGKLYPIRHSCQFR